MFERASIINLPNWEDGKQVLDDFAMLSNFIQKQVYSENDKNSMLEILSTRHKGVLSSGQSRHILLNEIRGRLIKKPRNAPIEIGVNGRNDWIGWFELKTDTIKEVAIENTARVIREVNGDVLCLIEVENRLASMSI